AGELGALHQPVERVPTLWKCDFGQREPDPTVAHAVLRVNAANRERARGELGASGCEREQRLPAADQTERVAAALEREPVEQYRAADVDACFVRAEERGHGRTGASSSRAIALSGG